MGTLVVKNVPADLHAAVAERARSQGISISEHVIRLLRRDLSTPTLGGCVGERRAHQSSRRPIDVVGVLDEVRAEYDPHHPAAGPISS